MPMPIRAALVALSAVSFLMPGALARAQQPRPEVVASGLQHPWGMAFVDGGVLVTERAGRLRWVSPTGQVGAPIAGLPAIDVGGQGGLLDVVADSGFATNRRIYLCYAEPSADGGRNATALASARLSEDGRRLEQWQRLFGQQPQVASRLHFGCRIVESPDGQLFLTLGERYHRMADAQTLDNHLGKVVRLRKDGGAAPGNPLLGRPGALPEIWSWGHRNPQGAAWGPDQRLWITEHGPQGGDEINRPDAGQNHGWPLVTYGENYGGGAINGGLRSQPGLVQPLHHWTPSIAPSGMSFLRSQRYGSAWQGQLFVGSLKFRYLARLELDLTGPQPRVLREHKLLPDLGQSVRDVREGPDGLLYLLTDERNGQLIRLLPPS